jgi:hypothetical protein
VELPNRGGIGYKAGVGASGGLLCIATSFPFFRQRACAATRACRDGPGCQTSRCHLASSRPSSAAPTIAYAPALHLATDAPAADPADPVVTNSGNGRTARFNVHLIGRVCRFSEHRQLGRSQRCICWPQQPKASCPGVLSPVGGFSGSSDIGVLLFKKTDCENSREKTPSLAGGRIASFGSEGALRWPCLI